MHHSVLHRVTELERRVDRIERRLQTSGMLETIEETVEPPRETPDLSQWAPVDQRGKPLQPPVVTDEMRAPAEGVVPSPPPPVMAPAAQAFDDAPSSVIAYAPRTPSPAPPPVEQGAIEQAIGLKWAGWIGAVVLVIGAGLGINFAWENGWFDYFPPAARLLLMSAGALALIGAGELVYRRVSHVSAAGLFGAGVASLYLVAYAGHAYYELYGRSPAFGMMVLATVIGAAVAMRGKLVSIATLALIGGNLAPLVLKGEQTLAPFLFYLLMLQLIALSLAWWGAAPKWWALRGLSLATLWMWMGSVLPGLDPATRAGWPLVFVPLYAAMFQLELICSATRRRGIDAPPRKTLLDNHIGGDVAWSLLVTATLTATLFYLLEYSTDGVRGTWVLALAAISGALGFALSRRTNHPRYPLAIGFRAQAAGLVVLAVPTLLSGPLVTTGWSLLAIAFAYLGMRLNLKLSRWAGVATWLLAIAHLGIWSLHPTSAFNPRQTMLTIYGTPLPMYLVSAWALTWVGHVVAWLTHAYEAGSKTHALDLNPRDMAWITGARAGIVWVAASMFALPPLGATLAIIVYAWLLIAADFLTPRLGFYLQAAAAVAVAVVKWVIVDSLAERLSPGWQPLSDAPIFNATMAMGLLIALTMIGVYVLRRAKWDAIVARPLDAPDDSPSRTPLLVIAVALIALASFAFTLELDRVVERGAAMGGRLLWPPLQLKLMAWNMLWAVSLAGLAGAVIRLQRRSRRQASLHTLAVGMVLLGAKFIVLDTLLWRLGGTTRSVPFLFNLLTLDALFVVAGLVGAYLLVGAVRLRNTIGFLILLVLLWTGTLELDRAFSGTARHVAISIFWSAFALGTVLAGFRFRVAQLRYFGLALFALTLMKVVAVDMAEARTGYRVLSFMGLGLLLLGTSVLYGKLSPKLLKSPA